MAWHHGSIVLRSSATLHADHRVQFLMSAPAMPRARAARRAAAPDRPGAPPDAPRATLTPDAWIDAATAVLVDRGIDHLRVDVLAAELQVTRGSFYWHFRDREDLLRRVLQAWRERATEELTRRLERVSSDARVQLKDVISLPFRGRAAARAARIELAIRAWARRDEMARQAVDEADASRLRYHEQIFEALGFAAAEARSRAFLLYSYEVAESLLHRQGSAAQREERCRFVEQLMLQPLGAESARPREPIGS
jgi:AcrR family transcriptional regulator